MKKLILSLLALFFVCLTGLAQTTKFPSDPYEAKFVTSDLPNFWLAFDSLGVAKHNPFQRYIAKGTKGLEGFMEGRILHADSLLLMVEQRKADYEKMRNIESKIREKERETLPYFYGLKYWYPEATFPPVYFVFGRFSSGGTSSPDGLIIGAEKLTDLEGLPDLVIHESIHFQQKWPEGKTTLLEHSILEGSADFMAELVTGKHLNKYAHEWGNANKDWLCKEFVAKMHTSDFTDWLYITSGKDKRPNDLGYWMGYQIVKAYFEQHANKKQAVRDILNIEDYTKFLQKSGYLKAYTNPKTTTARK